MVAAVGHESRGILHVGTGVGTSTTQVAQWIIDYTKSESAIEHARIDAEAPNVRMDYSKAQQLFGWQPEVDLDTGLRRTLEVGTNGHE